MKQVEIYDQGCVPFEELNLFRLTRSVNIPWVNPVTYWAPRRLDIQAIAAMAKVASDRKILDLACGNGFISSLLAEEVPVVGIDPNTELLAKTPYRHPRLELVSATAEEFIRNTPKEEVPEVVFNSWMPKGINLSDHIYALNPKMVVFVRDGWGSTGAKDSYAPRDNYQTLARWTTLTTADIANVFDELNWMLPGQHYKYQTVDQAMIHPDWEKVFPHRLEYILRDIPMTNTIDVRVRNDVAIELPLKLDLDSPYPWEKDCSYIFNEAARRTYPDNRVHNPPIT